MAIGSLKQPPLLDTDQSSTDGDRRATQWALLGCAVVALIAFVRLYCVTHPRQIARPYKVIAVEPKEK